MAPEAATGVPLDARADVYAVGVLLFEMLTGQRPFEGEPIEILRRRLKEDAPTMRAARPDLAFPDWLDHAVTRALTRAPADRFQTASEMSAALALPTPPAGTPITTTTTTTTPDAPTPRPPYVAIGLLAVLGVGALVWSATTTSEPQAEPVEPTAIAAAPEAPPDPEPARPEPEIAAPAEDPEDVVVVDVDPPPETETAPPPSGLPPPETETAPPPSEVPPPSAVTADPIPTATANPWDADVPAELAALARTVHRPTPPDRDTVRALRTYAQAHRDDPRPVLLLGHAFARMHWMDEALETYTRAFAMSPAAQGDPEVLPNLVALAAAQHTSRAASNLIASTYGAEAAPVIDATLAAPDLRPDDRDRLVALQARLSGL
jgi:serine/threonine-protein kinase